MALAEVDMDHGAQVWQEFRPDSPRDPDMWPSHFLNWLDFAAAVSRRGVARRLIGEHRWSDITPSEE